MYLAFRKLHNSSVPLEKNDRLKRTESNNNVAFCAGELADTLILNTKKTEKPSFCLKDLSNNIKYFCFDKMNKMAKHKSSMPFMIFLNTVIDNRFAKPANPYIEVVDDKLVRGTRPVTSKFFKLVCPNIDFNENKFLNHFKKLKENNVSTIIDLTRSNKIFEARESNLAKKFGMSYVHMPLTAVNPPTEEEVKKYFEILTNSPGKVYIHCQDGKDRTGTLNAIYKIMKYGYDDKQNIHNYDFKKATKEMQLYRHDPKQFINLTEFVWKFDKAFHELVTPDHKPNVNEIYQKMNTYNNVDTNLILEECSKNKPDDAEIKKHFNIVQKGLISTNTTLQEKFDGLVNWSKQIFAYNAVSEAAKIK